MARSFLSEPSDMRLRGTQPSLRYQLARTGDHLEQPQMTRQHLYMYLYDIIVCRNSYLVTRCASALSANHIASFSSYGITAVSFSNEPPVSPPLRQWRRRASAPTSPAPTPPTQSCVFYSVADLEHLRFTATAEFGLMELHNIYT